MQKKDHSVLNLAVAALTIFAVGACQKVTNPRELTPLADNLVQAGQPGIDKELGEGANRFKVLGSDTVKREIEAKRYLSADSKEGASLLQSLSLPAKAGDISISTAKADGNQDWDKQNNLILGFPVGLLGEQQVFGGVVTKLSDKTSDTLGRLKLIDLDPVHVKTVLVKTNEEKYILGLAGCIRNCTESTPQSGVISLPVVGVDKAKENVLVDLSGLGDDLNLIQMLDPMGNYTKLETVSSKTVSFDYSVSTLVFDVEVRMVPIGKKPGEEGVTETVFTVRWYLKLGSGFNPAFTPRPATPGVGYFMTARVAAPKVQRFSQTAIGNANAPGPVKYFIKNVPNEHRAAFASAFDTWNDSFKKVLGRKLLSYEFIEANDPRNALLVAGDPRFNIVEWDLVNKAPYGGLGPSMANQYTGEIFSANVLIQGPTIISLYKEWFEANQLANEARREGDHFAASEILRTTQIRLETKVAKLSEQPKLAMTLGNGLGFRVPSQMKELDCSTAPKLDFEPIPTGFTYESYMKGYFHEMLTHELGHNMGLRHNFRGNLGFESLTQGKVSWSIMEYLGRGFRHLNDLGVYDEMAIAYGYSGVEPKIKDRFCTDEDVSDANNLDNSAECSRDDATNDPYGFFEARLKRAVSLLVLPKSPVAPTWTIKDMERDLTNALNGVGLYAATAEKTGDKWTNFFSVKDRPTKPSEVKSFVLTLLKSLNCDPAYAEILKLKESEAAKAKTEANIKALQEKTVATMKALKVFTADDLKCQ